MFLVRHSFWPVPGSDAAVLAGLEDLKRAYQVGPAPGHA